MGRGQWDISYWEGKLLVKLVACAIMGVAEWKKTKWRCCIAASVLPGPKNYSRIFCVKKSGTEEQVFLISFLPNCL